MRTITVVTVARSDYGIYLPILRCIQADPKLQLKLFVSGMHLSQEFGLTVKMIEADGFKIIERVEMLLSSDSPEGIAKSIGVGVLGFAQTYSRQRPDILLVLGDRFEMYTAVLAALPFKIPVAHIHGGEVTHGAIDDALRHSITKLSHVHFVSHSEYARRVMQMGEEPWRVVISGAPSLDNIKTIRLLTLEEMEAKYNLRLHPPPLLVTFHPVTLEYEQTERQMSALLASLTDAALPIVFTLPNADTNGRVITSMIREYIRTHPSACIVENFGSLGYFSLMAYSAAMVGNSSSGLIEAPSFALPVVNVGTRQTGRVRGINVIDVSYGRANILAGIQQAIQPEFRKKIRQMENPYGRGRASDIIVERLKTVPLDDRLLMKRFCDLEAKAPSVIEK